MNLEEQMQKIYSGWGYRVAPISEEIEGFSEQPGRMQKEIKSEA